MRLVRFLQFWLSGIGTPLHVTDFVPETHPLPMGGDLSVGGSSHAIEQSFTNGSRKNPSVADGPCPSASCSPWSCSRLNWAPPMRISAIGYGPTLPSCMPVASATIKSILLKPTLCCPRPSASFVAALTNPHGCVTRYPSGRGDGRRAGQPGPSRHRYLSV